MGVNYMRIACLPFGREVDDFLNRHEIVFVVEQNRDAQLRSLLTLETSVDKSRAAVDPALQWAARSPRSASSME